MISQVPGAYPSPVPYLSGQTVLGHYSVAQKSGATVSLGVADAIASIRWVPTVQNSFLVLVRIKVGWIVTGAITTATPMDCSAWLQRRFTVDFSAASTAINMNALIKTNAMRTSMGSSQMGVNGPRICTTGAMTGETSSNDQSCFAVTTWNVPSILTGTVSVPAGVSGGMETLYEWTGIGQHPVVLGNNEGVILRLLTAGPTTGTIAYYTQWEWCEALAF